MTLRERGFALFEMSIPYFFIVGTAASATTLRDHDMQKHRSCLMSCLTENHAI